LQKMHLSSPKLSNKIRKTDVSAFYSAYPF
jgi:hypothetical protein